MSVTCKHELIQDQRNRELERVKVMVDLAEIDLDKWFNPNKLAAQVSAGLLHYRKLRKG